MTRNEIILLAEKNLPDVGSNKQKITIEIPDDNGTKVHTVSFIKCIVNASKITAYGNQPIGKEEQIKWIPKDYFPTPFGSNRSAEEAEKEELLSKYLLR